jgi:hypothetical protein
MLRVARDSVTPGVVRALCYDNSSNQTRARLAGVVKVCFLLSDYCAQ